MIYSNCKKSVFLIVGKYLQSKDSVDLIWERIYYEDVECTVRKRQLVLTNPQI